MTYLRNFIGLTIAVGFGVWNASYALKPALEEEASKRTQKELDEAAERGRAQAQGPSSRSTSEQNQQGPKSTS